MKFDIIVIGGGHAGVEAAYIAARQGCSTLLVTSHVDLIGQMSCNPAIGGIAKGNIVREVDALGGIMGRAIDVAGIHFKMLNTSKGMAVWGNRAQADKLEYRQKIRTIIEERTEIQLFQGMVTQIYLEGEAIKSVIMDCGEEIFCRAIVIAAGTFLNGLAHIGLNSFPAGRTGEPPSLKLSECIESFGILRGRLKTGTPARLDGRTVDFSKLTVQAGDENPWPFSYSTTTPIKNRTHCWITRTNKTTHAIIGDNLDRSPLYTGKIKSIGPRYCPSIEDKVKRFGERDGHTLFLEPEGLTISEMYLNGLSTSLPLDVQQAMVNSIAGLEQAKIIRPGYGIEYDYFLPNQLKPTLESNTIRGLFFAGQINGTSGYEEAAGQGILAGINAAAQICDKEPLILTRDSSYIGVLVDDLITKGTDEPYRMFTSRAEYRLLLRQDNSDQRLMPWANDRGLIDKQLFEQRTKLWEQKKAIGDRWVHTRISPQVWNEQVPLSLVSKDTATATSLLRRPEVTIDCILSFLGESIDDRELKLGLEADIKYSGFVENQRIDALRFKKLEEAKFPQGFKFSQVEGLQTEAKIKLEKSQPQTIGQASRISGITPADISILLMHI